MPTAIKRRNLATDRNAPASRTLNAFTTVSKASAIAKVVVEKNTLADGIVTTLVPSAPHDKKRKFIDEEEGVLEQDFEVKPLQRTCSAKTPRTPHRPIKHQSPQSIETPTKGARSLLDRFCLSNTPTKSPLSLNNSSSSPTASTPRKQYLASSDSLPVELVDLVNLHAAFLTALSIHYAHNGTHSPADLRNLCPDVARAWGKRRVTLEDVRRILGALNAYVSEDKEQKISRLSLSDYGHGKICIEIRTVGKVGRIARPVNEDLLNEIFEKGLRAAWEEADVTTGHFLETIPMEAITTCSSLLKMSPLLAKGQRRLEDLKSGFVIEEATKIKIEVTTNGTRPTLLERLRAKQTQQANLPPPPSKAKVARQAALGRIEEVVAVVAILSTSTSAGQQRISFTLPTVLGKLRDSFKTPMSKEEADTCVRLLAEEIAPEWVKLVKMGKVEALVVNRDERPKELDIEERVRCAAGKA